MMPEINGATNRGWKSAIKGIVMLAVLAGGVYLARTAGLADMLEDTQWFNDHILGSGPMSVVIYLLVAAAFTGLGLPRQLVAFLGGFAFGAVSGTLLATLGSGMGCALAAGYARLGGREFVARKFGHRVKAIDAFLSREPFNMALTIRLFPLGSNLITNLAAGVSSIPLSRFVLGSTLGYIPQNLIFALFGSGLNADSSTGVALSLGTSAVLLAVSAWLGVRLYRRYRAEAAAAVGDE